MPFEVITTVEKTKRDLMFQELKHSEQANERQVTKFSGVQLEDGSPVPQYVSGYSVAYPVDAEKQRHGSKANPRKFAPRKLN